MIASSISDVLGIYTIYSGTPVFFQEITFEDPNTCMKLFFSEDSLSIFCVASDVIRLAQREAITDTFGPLQTIYSAPNTMSLSGGVLTSDGNSLFWIEF